MPPGAVLALTLGQAKAIALVVVVILIAGAIAGAWIMKEITQKVVLIVVVGLIVALVWWQRSSLTSCADDVRTGSDTCSFFGRDVRITPDRGE